MKRNRIIFVIVLLTFLILSVFAFFIQTKQSEYMELKQKRSFAILQQIVDGKIIFFRKMISKRLNDEIYENTQLKKYIKENNGVKLSKELKSIYKVVKRENRYIKSIHFITPSNIHIADIHGGKENDFSNYRNIVKEANKLKRAKYGFEIGDQDLLYRLELPIIFDKVYYGLIEIGVDPMLFVSDMTTIEKYLDAIVIVDSNKIKKYKEYDIYKKIVFEDSGYVAFDDKPLFQKALKVLDSNEVLTYNNQYYRFFKYNLLNFNAEVEGKFLFAIHTSDDVEWKNGLHLSALVILLIILVLFFIVIYFGFNYYDKKISILVEHDKQNERLLFQQSKMASMGEMIGNIAHQWRQPLSIITTAASGMQLQKEFNLLEDEQFNKSVDTIMKQANYMSKTIDDFRNFFQSDKEKIKFNVKEAILKDIRLLESSFKSNGVEVLVDIHITVDLVGHQNEFTQAILNILNNSKDQLKKLDSDTKVISVICEKTRNNLIITIKDNGGGIDENIIDKIFEPYFTTKHQSQGTGIGLFMTNEIISKHFFGKIQAKNEEFIYENKTYKGACFKITIPLED